MLKNVFVSLGFIVCQRIPPYATVLETYVNVYQRIAVFHNYMANNVFAINSYNI
jgi:hypothetical protein